MQFILPHVTREEVGQMNTLLEFAIVGSWVAVSVVALTRVFTERRRWDREAGHRWRCRQPC
jgi:hypothetical protein